MAASVALGVLLAAGGSCALRGTAERPGVEAGPSLGEPQDQVLELWRAGVDGCAAADRPWSQRIVAGAIEGRCEPVNLGVGPAVARRPAARPKLTVATTKVQEREPEELVGSGQLDTESAAHGGAGADATAGARPLPQEAP